MVAEEKAQEGAQEQVIHKRPQRKLTPISKAPKIGVIIFIVVMILIGFIIATVSGVTF